jgi:hypothetical protein
MRGKVDQRVSFETRQEQLDAIEEWRRHQTPIPSRNEAIRTLIDLGLETAKQPAPRPRRR